MNSIHKYLIVFALACALSILTFSNAITVSSGNDVKVIVDAGHGLPDGGAVAPSGEIESDINLKIADSLYKKLSSVGINTVMTRTKRESIYTEGDTLRQKKISDTKNRVKIANEHSKAILISIHMNTFSNENVYGTHVFYKNNDNIANELQSIINEKYQKDNKKSIKQIPNNVYLFNHIKNDCILIECGFITNREDLDRFINDAFIDEFTQTICEVITFQLTGSETNGNKAKNSICMQ